LTGRDALEVYYVCVVLGFRGFYQDPDMAAIIAETHGLPPDLESWAKQTAMSIRLGQGRPRLAGPSREIHGAPPLLTGAAVVWPWLLAAGLGAVSTLYYTLFWTPS
jgi:type VI secretion system protein ImpK